MKKEFKIPRNPNKKPTKINIKRTIERMRQEDEELIQKIKLASSESYL